MINLLIFV
jgi:hypothetical protein